MTNEDKTCAFFRHTWWKTAKTHLSDSERLTLYEAVFSYQFDGTPVREDLPPMVAMLFDLIKPTLTADREKMQRRAETARANGANGGRPKINKSIQEETYPSGLNENPVGYSGLPIYNIQIQDTNTRDNLCVQATEINKQDTHTKHLCCIEFFLMGVSDPVEEGRLFWNYYDARGWKTGDGQPVQNVLALARSWHPKDLLVAAAKRRAGFRSLFKLLTNDDFSLFERLIGCESENSTQTLFLAVKTKADAEYVENRYLGDFSKWVKTCDGRSAEWNMVYRVIDPSE